MRRERNFSPSDATVRAKPRCTGTSYATMGVHIFMLMIISLGMSIGRLVHSDPGVVPDRSSLPCDAPIRNAPHEL